MFEIVADSSDYSGLQKMYDMMPGELAIIVSADIETRFIGHYIYRINNADIFIVLDLSDEGAVFTDREDCYPYHIKEIKGDLTIKFRSA